jgi:D-2-hydroxyacid dehydrogenase (NADP+)
MNGGRFARPAAHATVVFWLSVVVVAAAAPEADPVAVELIDSLSLRESVDPIRNHPRWASPEKIAIVFPPGFPGSEAELLAEMQAVAGGAEVILFDLVDADVSTIADADVLMSYCRPQVLSELKNLRWFHSYSVGVKRCLKIPGRPDHDFIMTNNQRLSAPSISELAIGMALMLSKNFPIYERQQNAHSWDRNNKALTSDLTGKTMLILGLGGIGTETARRASALGMRVTATRNSSREGPEFVDRVGLSDEMYELAAEADFIVNALPWTEQTDGLVGNRFFDAVKRGAYYINVGRGKTTVTADLVSALADGRLGGAGLDVVDPEPLPPGHPLWDAENIVITPHIAGRNSDALLRSLIIARENLRRYVLGEKILSVVDRDRGY